MFNRIKEEGTEPHRTSGKIPKEMPMKFSRRVNRPGTGANPEAVLNLLKFLRNLPDWTEDIDHKPFHVNETASLPLHIQHQLLCETYMYTGTV